MFLKLQIIVEKLKLNIKKVADIVLATSVTTLTYSLLDYNKSIELKSRISSS